MDLGEGLIWLLFKFTKNIISGKPIQLFNYGKHVRDFSYIDDVVFYILSLTNKVPSKKLKAPFRIYNIEIIDLKSY